MRICIDAGHGGTDSGAVGIGGRTEKADNLRSATALRDVMTSRGHTVYMTRTTDTYPTLDARVDFANSRGVDVFVSMHRNYYSDPQAHGFTVLYAPNASQNSINLARSIQSKVVAASGFRDRDVTCQGATVLNNTSMPANTIEIGFVSNVGDNSIFDSKLSQIVRAIADSLEAIFGAGTGGGDPYAYKVATATAKWVQNGTLAASTNVSLDSYTGGEMARIKLADGTKAYVRFADLAQISGYSYKTKVVTTKYTSGGNLAVGTMVSLDSYTAGEMARVILSTGTKVYVRFADLSKA